MSSSGIEASIVLCSVSLWLSWVGIQSACALNTLYIRYVWYFLHFCDELWRPTHCALTAAFCNVHKFSESFVFQQAILSDPHILRRHSALWCKPGFSINFTSTQHPRYFKGKMRHVYNCLCGSRCHRNSFGTRGHVEICDSRNMLQWITLIRKEVRLLN
jgi:hypothetical protein